jgi:hypothetical protein
MPPTTTHKTVSAIVARSLPLAVPDGTITLERGADGRFRLAEYFGGGRQSSHRFGVRAMGTDGHKLRPGHLMSAEEAERCVRALLGLGSE